MAKYMFIEVIKSEIIETEKAYGIPYVKDNCYWQDNNVLWLPKSQVELEDVTYDMYKEVNGEFNAKWYFRDGYAWITVPMWLARNNNYFKHMIFHL